MNNRDKRIWLPGLMTLVLTLGLFWLLVALGFPPRIFRFHNPPLMFSLPWTLALPVIGALGAYASRRSGGKAREQLLAALFAPALLTLIFVVVLPLVLIAGSGAPRGLLLFGFASAILNCVVIPGTALFVGVLPFLLCRRHEPSV